MQESNQTRGSLLQLLVATTLIAIVLGFTTLVFEWRNSDDSELSAERTVIAQVNNR